MTARRRPTGPASPHRSSWGLRTPGLVLAAALTTSCGFSPQTNMVNNIAEGAEERSGTVDVLNAVVIAGEANLGVFSASLVNPRGEDQAMFVGLVPTDDVAELGEYGSADVPAGELVDLSDTGGVPVRGEFRAGQHVSVIVDFAERESVTMNVPVVTPCNHFSRLRLDEVQLPGADDEFVEPAEPVEGDTDPELGEGPGTYTCEVEPGP